MCARYELKTKMSGLPSLLRRNLPKGFEKNYEQQELIRPNDPVIVVKNEGKVTTSIMIWGFICEWVKDPFAKDKPRPFNARVETVGEKKLFKSSWKYKRCLIPATGFYEKGCRISRKDEQTFWLGGIWNRWMSFDGSELESCCILTTKANSLLRPLHNRMPVIISDRWKEKWIASVRDSFELREFGTNFLEWNEDEWKVEPIQKASTFQMSLF